MEFGAGCVRGFCDYNNNTEIFSSFFLSAHRTVFQLGRVCVQQVVLEVKTTCQNDLFLEPVYIVKHKEKIEGVLGFEKSRSLKSGLQEPPFPGVRCSGALSVLTQDTESILYILIVSCS